jgi:threonine dehydrogenase-like Zn-dependent dehydrogenase
VFTADGFEIFVVEADVAHELSGEVANVGEEDASGDDVAFDFGEDQLHCY